MDCENVAVLSRLNFPFRLLDELPADPFRPAEPALEFISVNPAFPEPEDPDHGFDARIGLVFLSCAQCELGLVYHFGSLCR